MEDTIVPQIRKGIKKKFRRKVEEKNIAGDFVKSKLEEGIENISETIISENLKANLGKVIKNKATDASYKLIKEKIKKNVKQELAEYASQKAKDVFESITTAKKEEIKKRVDEL